MNESVVLPAGRGLFMKPWLVGRDAVTPEAVGLGATFVALAALFTAAGFGHGNARAVVMVGMLVLTAIAAVVQNRPGGVAPGGVRILLPWLAVVLALVPAVDGVGNIAGVHHIRVLDGLATAVVLAGMGVVALYPDMLETRRGRTMALLLLAVALLVPTANLISGLALPKQMDIGTTTADAARAMIKGLNPYALPIDQTGVELLHDDRFSGFKYLPAMPALYMPFVLMFGDPGIIVANALLWVGMAIATLSLSHQLTGTYKPIVVLLLAATATIAVDPLALGATDIAPVVMLLAALVVWRRSALFAGLLLGLSLSMKLTPAMFVLPLFLPSRIPSAIRYVLGALIGMLPILPYAVWAPHEVLDNIILFNFMRAPDVTSLRFQAPGWASQVAAVAGFLVWGGFSAWCVFGGRDLLSRLYAVVTLLLVVLLSASNNHDNYAIWWMPLLALLVGIQGYRSTGRSAARMI